MSGAKMDPGVLAREFCRDTYGPLSGFEGEGKERYLGWLGVATLAVGWMLDRSAGLEERLAPMAEIGELLRTQDNRATAHPIFIVQQRRRIYGLDPRWAEHTCWLQDGETVEEELAQSLEAGWRESMREPPGYSRTGYLDLWEYVTACLTEKGAEDYIRLDGHNLREPRIYAASGYRNEEVIALRAFLLGLAPEVGHGPAAP